MFYSDFSRRPINQEHPCGINPNELDDFEKVKRQINNLNRVSGDVSWSEIEIISRKILTYHAKDLRCACYYALALTHNGGLKGLIEGLAVISDICLIYWDGAFPDKNKDLSRISIFEWYVEYVLPLQRRIKITPKDLPLVELGSYLCVKIEEELRSHYGNRSPSLGGLRRTFDAWSAEIVTTKIMKNEDTHSIETIRKTEKKNNYGIVFIVLSPVFILFFTLLNVEYKERIQRKLIDDIKSSSIYDFNIIMKDLGSERNTLKKEVKSIILKRTQSFLDDLIIDPLKLNKIESINEILIKVNELYPDSMLSKEQFINLNEIRTILKDEYLKINNDFLSVRTYFANMQNKETGDIYLKKAYYYTNTLFPLLGRIEYAQKEKSFEELEKAQKQLNVYQYKINEIKDSLAKQ